MRCAIAAHAFARMSRFAADSRKHVAYPYTLGGRRHFEVRSPKLTWWKGMSMYRASIWVILLGVLSFDRASSQVGLLATGKLPTADSVKVIVFADGTARTALTGEGGDASTGA